mgnify:CR=1 FL=1|jgi:hypothetical protein
MVGRGGAEPRFGQEREHPKILYRPNGAAVSGAGEISVRNHEG